MDSLTNKNLITHS